MPPPSATLSVEDRRSENLLMRYLYETTPYEKVVGILVEILLENAGRGEEIAVNQVPPVGRLLGCKGLGLSGLGLSTGPGRQNLWYHGEEGSSSLTEDATFPGSCKPPSSRVAAFRDPATFLLCQLDGPLSL